MLKAVLKVTLILLINSTTSSCRPNYVEPTRFFKKDLESASPDFKQGWEDGCKNGMSGGNNSFQQWFYKNNRQDGYKFTYSPDYKIAWQRSYWVCYRADFVNQRKSTFKSIFGGLI